MSDSGKGIEPVFLPYVFEPFRQADASTTRAHGGLGLGLAIVRQLIELHGGTVRADSEGLDRGSWFTVSLPVQEPGAAPASDSGRHRAALASAGPPDLTGVRVMVVDDDRDTRELIGATLGYYGADVTVAESAAEALALLPEVRPDVLLSDIGMSGEDGYTFISRVRTLAPERGGLVPAVAVTAYAAAGDRARAVSAGFQLHVSKPFDPIESRPNRAAPDRDARQRAVEERGSCPSLVVRPCVASAFTRKWRGFRSGAMAWLPPSGGSVGPDFSPAFGITGPPCSPHHLRPRRPPGRVRRSPGCPCCLRRGFAACIVPAAASSCPRHPPLRRRHGPCS